MSKARRGLQWYGCRLERLKRTLDNVKQIRIHFIYTCLYSVNIYTPFHNIFTMTTAIKKGFTDSTLESQCYFSYHPYNKLHIKRRSTNGIMYGSVFMAQHQRQASSTCLGVMAKLFSALKPARVLTCLCGSRKWLTFDWSLAGCEI